MNPTRYSVTAERLALTALTSLLAGCSVDAPVTPLTPAAPRPTAVAMPGVTVISDSTVLASFVIPGGGRVLPLVPENVPDRDVATSRVAATSATLTFTLAAQVAPPVVSGQTLQATHIVKSEQWAYVTYATIGAPTLGAVDVYQIGGNNAKLMARATFATTEYYAVDTDGSNLYLVGATSDSGFAERAVLDIVSLSGKKLPNNYVAIRIPLPSYAGTGVSVDGTYVWVTSGSGGPNTGGLSVYAKSNFAVLNRYSFLDARGVHSDGNYVAVMSGTPGTARIYSQSGRGQLGAPISIGGATIAESKGTAWVDATWAFFAAGDGGTRVVSLASGGGTIRGSGMVIPSVIGVPASLATTNAVFVDVQSNNNGAVLVFTANGEAGVQAYSSNHHGMAVTSTPTISYLGRISFGTTISANFVAGGGGTILIAAGLGGLKILTY